MAELTEQIRLYEPHRRQPRIAAIGGGHGLSAMLRGLKTYTKNITAIVTVADDGGASCDPFRTATRLIAGFRR